MTRDEFAKLTEVQQSAIYNYQSTVSYVWHRAIEYGGGLVMLVSAPILFHFIIGPSKSTQSSSDQNLVSFVTVVVDFFSRPIVIGSMLAFVFGLGCLIMYVCAVKVRQQRRELLNVGLTPKDIKGLRDEDVFELFLIPQLKKQGVPVLEDEPYGHAN
ncbi:hypothetical protein ACFFU8_09280 [Chromobacterium piscinae]|uniref:hypothetical protein n=1 Tax=Chromobacterium piscinae TaxID=686831 RepID=UPI001E5E7CBE|nr:hypothetical protein [Chromobacterium piscinae]MCD5327904.1 hypothetical protein [Chromobacterium piscinae]